MFNFADEILFYRKYEMKSSMCERNKGAITRKWLRMNTSNNHETLFTSLHYAKRSKFIFFIFKIDSSTQLIFVVTNENLSF